MHPQVYNTLVKPFVSPRALAFKLFLFNLKFGNISVCESVVDLLTLSILQQGMIFFQVFFCKYVFFFKFVESIRHYIYCSGIESPIKIPTYPYYIGFIKSGKKSVSPFTGKSEVNRILESNIENSIF